jgi:hypothetical protein
MMIHRSDAEIFQRAKNDLPLSLRELSVASGHCYSIVKRWRKNGLPMLDGRITLKEALEWRRSQEPVKSQPETRPQVEIEPPASIAGHPLLQRRARP